MINYFFFPESYNGADLTSIKSSVDGLNEAMVKKNKNELFYEDSSFYLIQDVNGQFLFEKLSHSYKDLTTRVIPSMLRRMKHTAVKVVDNITLLDTQHSDAWVNCIWGLFPVEDKHHICSFKFFCLNRKDIALSVSNGMNFHITKSFLLDKVQIADNAMEQISNLGSGSDFNKVLKAICQLDCYNMESWKTGSFQLRILQQNYNVTISDESDTVKRNPLLKQQRYFKVSDEIGSQYCFYHLKLDNIRIHIYPNEFEKVIYVTYVGKHLDLR